MRFDTIVAPITGAPPAAVAWIRLSGPEAWTIAGQIFSPWPPSPSPRLAVYGKYTTGDDGLALPFAEGHSYTGEESAELSMHGSYASVRAVLDACLVAGARMAEPGEFTQRAFLNGRIDLTQAEAVRESIEAVTEVQLRQAARNLGGALLQEVQEIQQELATLLATLEASVDFSEEIGEFDREVAGRMGHLVHERISWLREEARHSRVVREGYRVAIIGPPNAGKSSLLNRLLKSERSIVTPVPGTTRDFVEERVDLDGVAAVFIDTAGIRETSDVVESIGVERARKIASEADQVWFLYDGTIGLSTKDEAEIASLGSKCKVLANKDDLGFSHGTGFPISVLTGYHIDDLVNDIRAKVLGAAPEIPVNERQATILAEAEETMKAFRESLRHDGPDDLLSVYLRDLISTLGRITGETAEPDMIDRIFHDFCVGK